MNSIWTQDVYVTAWDFATLAHHGQTYGGPIEGQQYDYINHIGSVAMELIWALAQTPNLDGNLAVQCALLHDVLEDTDTSFEQLQVEFGTCVAQGVSALTKNETLSTKQDQMIDSLKRIKEQPLEVWMVKLSDRITNLSAPPFYWTKEKKINYQKESMMIYDELHSANPLLAARLLERIANYQEFIDQK